MRRHARELLSCTFLGASFGVLYGHSSQWVAVGLTVVGLVFAWLAIWGAA